MDPVTKLDNFLTNTSIAYTLLMIAIILLGYVIWKTSDENPRKTSPKKRS